MTLMDDKEHRSTSSRKHLRDGEGKPKTAQVTDALKCLREVSRESNFKVSFHVLV